MATEPEETWEARVEGRSWGQPLSHWDYGVTTNVLFRIYTIVCINITYFTLKLEIIGLRPGTGCWGKDLEKRMSSPDG